MEEAGIGAGGYPFSNHGRGEGMIGGRFQQDCSLLKPVHFDDVWKQGTSLDFYWLFHVSVVRKLEQLNGETPP